MNKKPEGADLISMLIKLLADQEGVKISYDLKEGEKSEAIYT